MGPEELAKKTDKVIELNSRDAIINEVYFNPLFANDLSLKIPELDESNVNLSQTETETEDGSLVSATVLTPTKKLNLGSVLLDGKTVVVKQDLVTVERFIEFIEKRSTGI